MQYRDFPGDIAMKTLLNNAGATGSTSGQGIKIYLKYNTRNKVSQRLLGESHDPEWLLSTAGNAIYMYGNSLETYKFCSLLLSNV